MPIDYSKGKIYCIRSPNTDLIYIGSTCQKLSQRMGEHRINIKKNRNTTSKIIFEYGEPYIELLENYPCNNKEELLKKEGEHIRTNNCCNKYIAGRTHKQYYEDNKEQQDEQHKQYYEINKEKIKEYVKEYYETNKEKIKEQNKEHYEANKKQKQKQRKQYKLNNPEKIKEQEKQSRERNKEKHKEYKKQWREQNKEKKLREKINEIKNEILKEFKILKEEKLNNEIN